MACFLIKSLGCPHLTPCNPVCCRLAIAAVAVFHESKFSVTRAAGEWQDSHVSPRVGAPFLSCSVAASSGLLAYFWHAPPTSIFVEAVPITLTADALPKPVRSALLRQLLSIHSKDVAFSLQVTNKLLQEEKESREALLGRQFDLIACFEQNSKRKSQDRSNLSEGQLNTLEQIASAKAAISDVGSRKEEDIEVQELLAEGSFGKSASGCIVLPHGIFQGMHEMQFFLPPALSRSNPQSWCFPCLQTTIHPDAPLTHNLCLPPCAIVRKWRCTDVAVKIIMCSCALGHRTLLWSLVLLLAFSGCERTRSSEHGSCGPSYRSGDCKTNSVKAKQ
eukprot:498841-Pelagomonas_calceolata.AAC.2